MTQRQKLDTIFNSTHSDFKGAFGSDRYLLVCRKGATVPVFLPNLTDAEIAARLPARCAA